MKICDSKELLHNFLFSKPNENKNKKPKKGISCELTKPNLSFEEEQKNSFGMEMLQAVE